MLKKYKLIHGGKIVKGYINCKATIFGDFSNYIINSESIVELINSFKEYEVIPSVVKELEFEINNYESSQKVVERVQLNSTTHRLSINILSKYIRVEAQPYIEETRDESEIHIEDFIANTKKIFNTLFVLLNKKGNRISFIATYLDNTDLEGNYKKYINPTEFFKEKDVFEWSVKSVIREKINISDNEEEINIVSNIFRTKGSIKNSLPYPTDNEFEGVIHEIDINTRIENNLDRIDKDFVDDFYDFAISKKNQIERGY